MPDPQQQQKAAPDFIPASASPDFIPADGGQQSTPDNRGIISKGIDAAGNALNNFEDATIGTHTNEGIIKGFTEGIPQMVKHPIDSAGLIGSAILGAHTDTANNAIGQMKQPGIGNKIVGAGRYIQSGIPFLGPQLDKAGQQVQSGDVSGGIGTTLGVGSMIGGPKLGELGARGIGSARIPITNYLDQKMVKGSPEQLLTRATKPTIGLPEYEKSLTAALPELAQYSPKNLNDLSAAADKVKSAKAAEFSDLKTATGNSPVPTYSVGRQQMNSIPATNRFEDPNIIGKVGKTASRYNTTMPIEQADAIRMDTNAKLRDFYNKAGGDQNAALSHPETARIHAVNNGIRGELYDTIKGRTGIDPAPGQEMYGHAVDIGDTAARRNTVFSRQQPVPLVSQIAGAHASPVGFALSKYISGLNDSDSLVNRAFDRYKRNIGSVKMPQDPIRSVIAGPGKLRRDDE